MSTLPPHTHTAVPGACALQQGAWPSHRSAGHSSLRQAAAAALAERAAPGCPPQLPHAARRGAACARTTPRPVAAHPSAALAERRLSRGLRCGPRGAAGSHAPMAAAELAAPGLVRAELGRAPQRAGHALPGRPARRPGPDQRARQSAAKRPRARGCSPRRGWRPPRARCKL